MGGTRVPGQLLGQLEACLGCSTLTLFHLRTDQHRSGGSWISLNTPWQHKVAEGDPQTRITPPRDPGVWQDRGHHPLCRGLGVFGERNRKCRSFVGTAFSAGGCFLG